MDDYLNLHMTNGERRLMLWAKNWPQSIYGQIMDYVILRVLQRIVPADCRGALLAEYFFNRHAMHHRILNEIEFRSRLVSHWQR